VLVCHRFLLAADYGGGEDTLSSLQQLFLPLAVTRESLILVVAAALDS